MEITIFTPNLEIVFQDGVILLNYIVDYILEITAQIKI